MFPSVALLNFSFLSRQIGLVSRVTVGENSRKQQEGQEEDGTLRHGWGEGQNGIMGISLAFFFLCRRGSSSYMLIVSLALY